MSATNGFKLSGLPDKARVVAAMSGGVDSSVAAALLKHAGYDVVGITLQLYDHGVASGRRGACCAGQDIADAKRVAAALGIPHYVLDYEARFESEVMTAFADSYLAGETPIPCVACNQTVKFRDLLDTAIELGAAALVTGHYIRSLKGPHGWQLHRAMDDERDQSYFLFATTRAQLERLRFPLGGMTKAETRALAEKFELPVAAKADSQDICFVPTGRYTNVIERLRPGACEPGDIVHLDGRVLGRHRGIVNYTIGQRRGLGLAMGEPLYVVRLDAEGHQVIVGPREALKSDRIQLRDLNWLGDGAVQDLAPGGLDVEAKIRSTQAARPATLSFEQGSPVVYLRHGEDGVSPGQACVLYDGGRVLGGGWIAAAELVSYMTPMRGDQESARRVARA
jgi:tRNA-specific 2-thiouridylase